MMNHILQQKCLYCFTWSANQLLTLNIFSFSSDSFLLINPISFYSDPWIFCNLLHTSWLTCFQVSSHFLCFFGCCKCCLLWISRVMCNTRADENVRNNLYKNTFWWCKEWVRFWSYAALVNDLCLETFGSPSRNAAEKKKENENKKGNCKAISVTRKRKKEKNLLINRNVYLLYIRRK